MRFKFPIFKTNFFTQFVRFKNKARIFKRVDTAAHRKKQRNRKHESKS